MEDHKVFLRTTERRSYANCRQQWWWSFVEGWKSSSTKSALRFGDLVHRSLAERYPKGVKRGPHPADVFARLYDEQIEDGAYDFDVYDSDEGQKLDARDLGIEMLRNYVKEYGDDAGIEVISPEMPFSVDVFDKHGRYMVTYVGQLDLVYRDRASGQLGVMETKTAATISTRHLGLDEQAGSYWAFAPEALVAKKILKPGTDIDFIMYNFLRKAAADTRPVDAQGHRLNKPTKEALKQRCDLLSIAYPKSATADVLGQLLSEKGIDPALLGERSKSQPPPLFLRQKVYRDVTDRERLMHRVRAQAWEMAQVKAGKLPVYKNPGGTFPNQQCLGCEFADVCELHETGRDWEELARLTMTKWDPYEEHRGATVSTPTTRSKKK